MDDPRMSEQKLFTLDLSSHSSSGQPKHERLREHLIDAMIAGRLKPGQALPSEHRLVERLGVARTTVRQAMASLENEGLIRRVQGKGTFVENDVRRKLQHGLEIFALVVPETRSGFYPALLHGFEAASGEIHYQTLVCNTNNDVARQSDIVLQLIDKHVAGVVMVPASFPIPSYQIRQLHERGIPVVFCHRPVEGIQAPALLLPFYEQGRLAGEAFVRHGHRRAAQFLFGHSNPEYSQYTQQVTAGFRDALEAVGGEAPDELICRLPFTSAELGNREEEVFEVLQRICRRPDRPTAIMASFDNLAEVLFLQLGRLGLRIPEDVSLVGFGGADRRGTIIRQLASVTVDEQKVGLRAVELLQEMRNGIRPIDDGEQALISLEFTAGQTLGPAPAELRMP
ncbi:MAG: GntR family transcriptional regulator [Pirellulales bacterium]|nr:GntR family transcriptional regulator [Pirellulales bacterium]